MNSTSDDSAYHIYCDEFGDQGLKRTASGFFIVSAVVVRSSQIPEIEDWIRRIKRPMRNQQTKELHFAKLDEQMKRRASRFIGKLPVRCFTLISHKRNMIGHRNVRCEIKYDPRVYRDDGTSFDVPKPRRKTKYPNFVLKVLLERVTRWCHLRGMKEFGKPMPVDITIAQRGGFYLSEFKNYLEVEQFNIRNKKSTLPGHLTYSVVDLERIETAQAAQVPGLQLADVVTGSFSRAVDEDRFGCCERTYAYNLAPRIARTGQSPRIAGFGVTGLPWNLWEAGFTEEQQQLFRMFGYANEKLVRPGPILPDG